MSNRDLHNPGNLWKSDDTYQGEIKPSFNANLKQFIDDIHGYRAMFRDLHTKITNGINTVRLICEKWDQTASVVYMNHMTLWTGIPLDQELTENDSDLVIKIAQAIVKQEYSETANMTDLMQGYEMSNVWDVKKK